MEDANLTLRKRRERGKSAQRSFRQRQAAKALELRRRHDRLEELLAAIVAAHAKPGRNGLDLAISKACAELGLEGQSQCSYIGQPLQSDHEVPQVDSTPYGLSSCSTSGKTASTAGSDSSKPNTRHEQFGRFSPRLDYSVPATDPDRFGKNFQPPTDILPYVGKGEFTVAGLILWTCLEFSHLRLKEAIHYEERGQSLHSPSSRSHSDSNSDDESQSHKLWQRAVGHSKPLQDLKYMDALLEARLEYRKLGCMRQDIPTDSSRNGTDEAARQLVEGQVLHDLISRRVNLNDHWTALEIEQYVRTCMGPERFSVLQRRLSESGKEAASQNSTGDAEEVTIHVLAASLAKRAVCFGDGPRWHEADVRAVVHACFAKGDHQRAT